MEFIGIGVVKNEDKKQERQEVPGIVTIREVSCQSHGVNVAIHALNPRI